MNGFVYGGTMVPGMSTGNDYLESNYQGGDPGLNYRFLNIPEDNENNYSGNQLEESALFDGLKQRLFPCRQACKEELGGKGPGFRDCLRKCRGKGPSKARQAEIDAALQAQAIAALSSSPSASREQDDDGGSKTIIWIIVSIVVLFGIGLGIYFLNRKKAE